MTQCRVEVRMPGTPGNRRRLLLRRTLLAAVTAVPVVLIVLWMTFEHKPGWYRPAIADDATVQRAQASTAELVDSISDRLAVAKPFEVTLSERSVNDWLASLPRLWPEAGRAVPREITKLAVGFDADLLRIGGHYVSGQWQAILNLSLAMEVCDDGSAISIRLRSVHGGSLPVPRAILTRLVERLQLAAPTVAGEPSNFATSAAEALSKIRSVDELFDGIKIRNRFVWPNGDRPCRISWLTMDAGELRIGIEPL